MTEMEEFLEYFGDDVPHPEHEPRRFAYYVKLFRYHKKLKNE
jgi:hypothetical protein